MKTIIYHLLTLVAFASVVVGQSTKDKIEVGVQSTSLTLFHPDFFGDQSQQGIGGRVTYNLNRSLAAEAEINFFPQQQQIIPATGKILQAQFGVKAGKRFEKFGIFGKVRPGFLSVGGVFSLQPNPTPVAGGITQALFKFERSNFFTIDAGGVLEFYPSRKFVVRFDAGDTVLRYPTRFDQNFSSPTGVTLARGPKYTHNFQFSAGVGFRLGDFPAGDDGVKTSTGGVEQTPRYEVGVQFTSLTVDPPSTACGGCRSNFTELIHNEPGFGGRFTFNFSEHFALEAEGNYFTRDILFFGDPGGHMFQGQFGVKFGKRFEKWGLFAKARPGFVGFTKVDELIGTREIVFLGTPFTIGEFRVVKKLYPSIDLGGVFEFYVTRHWMTRFDVGDTIIRYGELQANGFSLSNFSITRPPETRHNLQISSGIGFRF